MASAWSFLFFPSVSVVGNDGRDPAGRGPAQRVQDDKELDQVLRDRLAGRLDEEDIRAADALGDLDVVLAVGEARDPHRRDRLAERLADLARQLRVSVAGEQLQRPRLPGRPLGRQRPGLAHSLADSGLGYFFAAFGLLRLARRRAVYPSTIFMSARPIARLPAGTSFVTTVSAAVVASLPTRTGATNMVSHET